MSNLPKLYTVINNNEDSIIINYDSYAAGQVKNSVSLTDDDLDKYKKNGLIILLSESTLQGPGSWDKLQPWQADTQYIQTPPVSLIKYNDTIYLCKITHRSTTSFDPTKWDIIIPAPRRTVYRTTGYALQQKYEDEPDNAWTIVVNFTSLLSPITDLIPQFSQVVTNIQAVYDEVLKSKTTKAVFKFSKAEGTLSAGQTDFSIPGGYTPGFVDVYLDGLRLIANRDFVATTGTKVVVTPGVSEINEMEIVCFTANNFINAAPLVHGHNVSDISGLDTIVANLNALSASLGQIDLTTKVDKLNAIVNTSLTVATTNNINYKIYSDTVDEVTVEAVDKTTSTSKKNISFGKYGGIVSVNNSRVITKSYADFTVTPTFPTVAATDNSTSGATTAFVARAVANLVASSPAALDTLNELATALGNDPNFATTISNALAGKANKAGDTFTGAMTFSQRPTFNSNTPWDSGNLVFGTAVGNAIKVQTGGKLPALDASLLTNLPPTGLDVTSAIPVDPTLDLQFYAKDVMPPFWFTRNSVATRVRSNGTFDLNVANDLRINHDPLTGACLGALIENYSVNIITNSIFASITTAPANYTVAYNTGTLTSYVSSYGSIDGSQAINIVCNNQRYVIQKDITGLYSNTTYTFSIYVESVSAALIGTVLATISSTSLAFASGSVTQVVYPSTPGRVYFTFTTGNSNTNISIQFGVGVTANATGSVIISRPQLETYNIPTSFIPTPLAATATRVGDSVIVPVTTDWFNGTEGTYYISGTCPISFINTTVIFNTSTTDYSNNLKVYFNSTGTIGIDYYTNGNSYSSSTTDIAIANSPFKYGFSYNSVSNVISMCLNNGTVITVNPSTGSMLTRADYFYIGQNNTSDGNIGSSILRTIFFPRYATPTQLKVMTSL